MISLVGYVDKQQGASLVEFSIIALTLVMIGLFTLQIGLLYHAKTTLNYAVFEAARTGAVNNASISAMRTELGIRLAPLEGGDGSFGSATDAYLKSSARVFDPLNTRIHILNPTKAAFQDWAIRDATSGKRVIPVNHLRHQEYTVGNQSGLSLRDATLLKIQVIHGVDLEVPVVGKLMTRLMSWADSANILFYLRGKWPLKSVAVVRMQSDALEEEVLSSAGSSGSGGSVVVNNGGGSVGGTVDLPSGESGTQTGSESGPIDVVGGDDPETGSGVDPDNTPTVDTEPAPLPPIAEVYCEPVTKQVLASAGRTPTVRSSTVNEEGLGSDSDALMSTSEFRALLAERG
ncbi:pilus assembly protein [Granulosicoccus sp.]|nr:pilus assembly protein [Granulosicoccus sp.]